MHGGGGACMARGMCGRGHVWWGACMAVGHSWHRGMHGGTIHGRGACMAGGVHGGRACMTGGMLDREVYGRGDMCGKGVCGRGAWVVGGMHGGGHVCHTHSPADTARYGQ